jgi:hypothetical protein
MIHSESTSGISNYSIERVTRIGEEDQGECETKDRLVGGHRARKPWRLDQVGMASKHSR